MSTTSKWVYRLSDGLFLYGGFYEPGFNPVTEDVVSFPDADPHPNVNTERYDAARPTKRRPATTEEQTAARLAVVDAEADLVAQKKDLLTMFAVMSEAYNPAWAAATNDQRRTIVQQLASRWAFWRKQVERIF